MSTAVIEPKAVEQQADTFDPAKFFADRNARDTAIRAGKEVPKVEPKPEVKAKVEVPAEPVKSDKPSGDKRTLFKTIRENERLKVELEHLRSAKPEPVKEEFKDGDEPKRADYATDQEYQDARTDWKAKATTEATLNAEKAQQTQMAEIQRIAKQFEGQMKAAADVEKGGFADWNELLKTSKASNVDIFTAAPEIYGAFVSSEYAKEVMHEWLLKPESLNFLIDTNKTDKGAAIRAFHRLEGRVARDSEEKPVEKIAEKPKEPEKKAVTMVEEKPKPRPSGSVRAPVGDSVPDEPMPGSKAWMERRNAQIKSRGW